MYKRRQACLADCASCFLKWTENTYQRKSQTHISVYGLEDSGIGAPVYSALGSCFAVEDANNAVALFLREIGDFASRIGEAVLVFDQSTWMPDAELWKSVQKVERPPKHGETSLKSALLRYDRHLGRMSSSAKT